MPVIQSTKDKVVVRFYAVGTSPSDAFFNGFKYENLNAAIFEQQMVGGSVYTSVKEFSLDEIQDITPTK